VLSNCDNAPALGLGFQRNFLLQHCPTTSFFTHAALKTMCIDNNSYMDTPIYLKELSWFFDKTFLRSYVVKSHRLGFFYLWWRRHYFSAFKDSAENGLFLGQMTWVKLAFIEARLRPVEQLDREIEIGC
jgi:hypothetical protein